MGRILKAYETRFRWLLEHLRARRLDAGVQHLVAVAQRLSAREAVPLEAALTRVYEHLAARPAFRNFRSGLTPSGFFCDAGLGGLARWLRAAGYEAFWEMDIGDDQLLHRAQETATTILTTDSMLMERKVLRQRLIPAMWLPPALGSPQQLALVFREYQLTLQPSRCMSCGGELHRVDKESLQGRIPPRTYRWLDEYFLCSRCGKLFWHGSHWQKIVSTLQSINASTKP